MNRKLLWALGAVLVLAVISGIRPWGGKPPVRIETEQGSFAFSGGDESGTITFQDKGKDPVTVVFDSAALVKGWPGDVPVFEPSRVVQTQVWGDKSAEGVFTTTEEVFPVAAFYKKKVRQKGWRITIARTLDQGATFMLNARKGPYLLQVNVTARQEGGAKIMVGKQEK